MFIWLGMFPSIVYNYEVPNQFFTITCNVGYVQDRALIRMIAIMSARDASALGDDDRYMNASSYQPSGVFEL